MADQLLPDDIQDPSAPQPDQLLDENSTTIRVTPDVADRRAVKYSAAMGEDAPSPADISQRIQLGEEDGLRQTLARQRAVEFRKQQMQVINNLVQSNDGKNPLTPEQLDNFYALTRDQMEDPATVMEKVFARRAVTGAIQGDSNPTFDAGLQGHTDSTLTKLDIGEGIVARQEGYRKIKEDVAAKWQQQNFAMKGLEYLQTMVPFATWYNTRSSEDAGILQGENRIAEYDRINALPIEQAIQEVQKRVDEIANNNVSGSTLDAMTWLDGLTNYTGSDRYVDDAMGVVDVAFGIPSMIKLGAKGLKAVTTAERTTKSVSDVVKRLARSPDYKPSEVLDAAGHTEAAAKLGAFEKLTARMNPAEAAKIDEVASSAPSIANLSSYIKGTKDLSAEAQRRILQAVDENSPDVLKAMSMGLRIKRLEEAAPEVRQAMVDSAAELVKTQYPNLADNIADVRINYDNITNTHSARVYIGDEDAVAFKTGESATNAAKLRGFTDAKIEQQGSGFWIAVDKPVDETGDIIRSLPIDLDAQTPVTHINMYMGRWRSPEDVLSKTSNIDRTVAATGVSELSHVAQAVAKDVGALSGKSRKKLFAFLEADRIHEETILHPDGSKESVVGRYATNLGELNYRWRQMHGRNITDQEAAAYMQFVRFSDLDYVLRNFRVYRDKARAGLEMFHFKTNNDLYRGIEGKTRTDLNWDARRAGVLILDDAPQYKHVRDLSKEQIDKMLADGYRITQVSPLGEAHLKGSNEALKKLIGDDELHYVLSRNYEISPLPIKQMRNRPGVHIEYTEGHYVAQPTVTRLKGEGGALEHLYRGDMNLFHFTNRAKAREVAAALDKVRVMLRDGVDDAQIDEFISATLPKNPDDIKALFIAPMDSQGRPLSEPPLSLHEPISARGSGERLGRVLDLKNKYANYRDVGEDPLNLYSGINLDYTGERGHLLESMEKMGSEYRPIFKTKQATLIDAQQTMMRSMKNLIDSRYLDDLKIKEGEKFMKEFGHFLAVTPEELRANPMKYIMNPTWVTHTVDPEAFAAAKNANRALQQFIGMRTKFSENLRWSKMKVLDQVYKRFGEKGLEIAEPWILNTTADPVRYARGVAFHFKLGMLNPVQLFVQGQAFAHTMAVAGPTAALKGLPATFLMRALRFTDKPEIINKFAEMSKAHGWNADHFKEAYSLMRETGWDRVDGSTAMKEDMLDPAVLKSTFGKTLDWSSTFFTEGNRIPRMAAMNAAYVEWRTANPLAKLTDATKKDLLKRADLLSINMTHASNASWQKGLASIPTQFFAYQARLMEQLMGGRLTKMEKLRVMGMYSTLYGLPVAGAAWLGVVPVPDIVKNYLISNSIPYDDNVLTEGLADGFASVILRMATGDKYNVGERYGPGGITEFRDWLQGDKDGFDLLVGVSGSSIGDMYNAIAPVASDVAGMVSGKPNSTRWLLEDIVDFTKEISTLNNTAKLVYGLNFSKLITKNEKYISETTPVQSIMSFLTGLTPSKQADAFTMSDILKAEDKVKKAAGVRAQKYFQRALRSDDAEEAQKYIDRAGMEMTGAGMDPAEQSRIWTLSTKGYESFVESMNLKFANSRPDRMDKFLKDQARDAKGQQ